VEFQLTPDMLALLDVDVHWVVEPGTLDIMVGTSSAQTTSVPLQVVEE